MIDELVIYFAVGKVSIYLIQKFPLTQKLSEKSELLEKLFNCNLCLGVWVYWFLAFLFGLHWQAFIYVPVLSELLFGACASFVMWLISLGWNSQFQTIVIE
jgi:hypothetical protein